MCRSELPAVRSYVDPAARSFVDAVAVGPDGCTDEADCAACKGLSDRAHTCGKTLDGGKRRDDPLVLQRGDFALDDYGTPRCHVTCYPHAPSPRLTSQAPPCRRAESGAEVLYKSYWHLFHLRRGLTLDQSVNPRQLRRLFTHYENRFAQCIPLLQHSANVNHRHATNKAVAIRVASNPEAFAKFREVVDDATFQSKLKRAQEAPKGAEAAEIMKTVVGFINAAVNARLGRCVARLRMLAACPAELSGWSPRACSRRSRSRGATVSEPTRCTRSSRGSERTVLQESSTLARPTMYISRRPCVSRPYTVLLRCTATSRASCCEPTCSQSRRRTRLRGRCEARRPTSA